MLEQFYITEICNRVPEESRKLSAVDFVKTDPFLMIVKCPFNKIQILCPAMIGLEKSFLMMYGSLGLNSHETVPLMETYR